MALTKVKGTNFIDGTITDTQFTNTTITSADMALDPRDADNFSSGSVPLAQLSNIPAADTTGITADIAVLGFKTAANGSLAKYNLIDQTVDAFEDASGIDSGTSSDAVRNAGGKYYAATVVAGATQAFTTVASTTWTAPAGLTTVTYLVVAGGGGGGATQGWDYAGGGGGAGGVRTGTHPITGGNNYNVVVGGGGAGAGVPLAMGTSGGTSTFDTINSSGGGGGGGTASWPGFGLTGGSAGGSSGATSGGLPFPQGNAGGYTPAEGNNGGNGGPQPGFPISPYFAGGGGGAGGVGGNARFSPTHPTHPPGGGGGNGGVGVDLSGTFGTTYGVSGWFGGGGGGGWNTYNVTGNPNTPGTGGSGGGGAGSPAGPGTQTGVAGTANTGGGGGGGSTANTAGLGGNGGSGVVLVKYDSVYAGTMTLVSNSTTAQTAPTSGDVVMTYTDGAGTAVINTDITAEYSADNGSTWTAMTLALEGTTGGHTILSSHNVTLTSTSGTSMRYRIKTLNQTVLKSTRIHAVSLGWA